MTLPTHRVGQGGPGGSQAGTIEAIGACLYLAFDPDARWVVVWPEGYELQGDTVLDQGGQLVARFGDAITLGGGEVPKGRYDLMQGSLVNDVPTSCREGPFWIAEGAIR